MATLQTITVDGFGVFRSPVTLRLEGRGRVLVTGLNHDTAAASSNGAGKTTIFKALTWALYGKTVDGLTTDVIHRRAKKAIVELSFSTEDGNEYVIRRERTPKTGKLRFTRTGPGPNEDMTQSKAAATQAGIEATFGMDFQTFRSTVLFGQSDHGRFASRDLGDAARKEILGRVLQLDQYRLAREKMAEKRDALQAELKAGTDRIGDHIMTQSSLETELARIEGKLSAMRDPDELRELAEQLRLTAEKRRLEFVQETETYDQAGEDLTEIREEQAALEAGTEKVRTIHDDTLTLVARAQAEEAQLVAQAQAEVCLTCGQAIPDAVQVDADQLDAAVAAAVAAAEKLARVKAVLKGYDDEARELRDEARTVERNRQGAAHRAKEAEKEREYLQAEADRYDEEARTVSDERTKAVAASVEIMTSIKEQTDAVDELLATGEAKQAQLNVVRWWTTFGLGSKGVPSFAIEQALPVINSRANKHLVELADGDITVSWSAVTVGSTGKMKEELTQHVHIEGVSDVMPSGGQQKKIELATELALAELSGGRGPMSLLLLDEALDGLDGEGGRRVCSWLEGLGAESIFVVTHDAALAEDFDRVITVVKKGGASTIEGGA